MKTFRFDDININEDIQKTIRIADLIKSKIQNVRIIFCISPLVHDMAQASGKDKERIFPKILNAFSDYRVFYKVNKCGIPKFPNWIDRAGHGLVHVDHRLLNKEAQEMSILTSCSLAGASIFVPPFNKWNKHTEIICDQFNIELVKFEDGWRCCEYNAFNKEQDLWYLHAREFTYESFKHWIEDIN
jgi:hypothetical protein